MVTQETVNENLNHADENGYTFDNWLLEEIAGDLIAYSAQFEDVSEAELIPLIAVWRATQRIPCQSCNDRARGCALCL